MIYLIYAFKCFAYERNYYLTSVYSLTYDTFMCVHHCKVWFCNCSIYGLFLVNKLCKLAVVSSTFGAA